MLQNRIKMLVFLLALVTAAVWPSNVAKAASLSDIPDRSEEEINYLMNQGVLSGYPDGTFKPHKEVTREEAATLIARALKLDGTQRNTVFSDVSRYSYASGYIQSSYEQGAISGYPDGTYKPKETMTRGQMAVSVSNAFSLGSGTNGSYGDVSPYAYYYDAVKSVTSAGVAAGYPDGTYRPESAITREEFALFVARALNDQFRVSTDIDSYGERVVTADILNVRSGPSTGYSIVGKLSEGTTVQVHKDLGNWLKISYGSLNGYVHEDYTTPSHSSRSHIIAIDAGHGDGDGGATANGLVEKEINLDVAKRVQKYLVDAGIQVVMTRDDDTFVELEDRVDYAVNRNADTFVSIHSNSFYMESANGIETYYSSASLDDRARKSMQLAIYIQNRLVPALDLADRGVKDVPYHVISKTPLPSALVELGFVTNDTDASRLGSDYWRERAAEAIAQGIKDYYNWVD
ncbi:N-acetylmuramoyl-L-alanine amidase [Halobacillus aidingensis]|uniref:N-acetylmuramoyl-L-alanine amidase n=1 Tax=Halobacillus aidingensis TaxID=240303 RepID=A0A1H0KM36_HALAD|nr:N-acetylmuramoyl-L-alanine amidase [Halobacillus aidingensis]SDO56832.1 N-acetylmuramoyl-L-alanine amidase [Halobacillus aidingensis]